MRQRRTAAAKEQSERIRVEFDTNIFKVSMDCLQNRGQIATGDAEFCTNCKAVFNQTSVIVEEEGKQIWVCEFCNARNEVMIGEEEIPQESELTYLIEAAAQVEQAEEEKKTETGEEVKKSDKISVVFCIDVSGSMRSQNRLEHCKSAMAAQITAMAQDNGERKVGIVAFDHNLEIIGDGIEKALEINDQGMMNNYD